MTTVYFAILKNCFVIALELDCLISCYIFNIMQNLPSLASLRYVCELITLTKPSP
jgi:hypothetical protein